VPSYDELPVQSLRRPDAVRSLATIRRGETVVVECILFDIVRTRCEIKGIHLGDLLRCRETEAGRLLLETARGALVAVEQQWARFVQVTAPSPSAAGSATGSVPLCA